MTDCLVCAALNEMCLPIIYSTSRVFFRLPASPRNKHNHRRTNTFSHFTNVDGLSCVFSAFSHSSSVSLCSPLNIINLSSPPTPLPPPTHYTVMTLPFHLISALSLPLPWPSSWSSRKRAISPPLLPSRSVSCRQHAIIPFCSILARLPAAQRELVIRRHSPAKYSWFHLALRFSRRCGGRRERQPGRSSRRRI